MDEHSASTPEAPEQVTQVTAWWLRLIARLIDMLIVGAAAFAFMFVGFLLFGKDHHGSLVLPHAHRGAFIVLVAAGTFLFYALYHVVLMGRRGRHNGQTVGKQLLDIQVVRENGKPVGYGYALLREVAVKVVLYTAIGYAGTYRHIGLALITLCYLWPLWDHQRRAAHDFLVRSRVSSV